MKGYKLWKEMDKIDAAFIEEAAQGKRRSRSERLRVMVSLAASVACVGVILGISIGSKEQKLQEGSGQAAETVDVSVHTTVAQEGAVDYSDNCYLIERTDMARMTEEDVQILEGLAGVESVELYGTTNRIQYYYQENVDYSYEQQEDWRGEFSEWMYVSDDEVYVNASDDKNYMRSAGHLQEEDLQAGRLPQAADEIVLYTSDESMLGQKLTIKMYDQQYMGDVIQRTEGSAELEIDPSAYANRYTQGFWGGVSYGYGAYCVSEDFTIVGILKEKTTQIFYAEEYCDMLSRAYAGSLYAQVDMMLLEGTEASGLQTLPGELSLTGNLRIGVSQEDSSCLGTLYSELDWNPEATPVYLNECDRPAVFVVYSPDCAADEVQVSKLLTETYYNGRNCTSLYNALLLAYQLPEGTEYTGQTWMEDDLSMIGYSRQEDGKTVQCDTLMKISDNTHASGAYVIEVGEEMFNRLYAEDGSYESAIFLEDDTDIAAFEQELAEHGYQLLQYKSEYEVLDRLYDDWYVVNDDGKVTPENYKEILANKKENE